MTTDAIVPSGWDLPESPFHAGEMAVQTRVGVRDKIEAQGRRAVRRYLTEQHRQFFPQLPMLFTGSVGGDGRPWASILIGEPGFLSSPDAHTLAVAAHPLFADPLADNLVEGAEIAALGIEFPTRRRNRVIGTVTRPDADGFAIAVRQTMGVCPKYIQARDLVFTADPLVARARPVRRSQRLDQAALAMIARADTFFVASANPRRDDGVAAGADVSHRGGLPGFVRIDDDRHLTTPDFIGNFIFNTLGNFLIDPRAGLLFVDFDSGDVLYVAATATIVWDGPEVARYPGAQRLIRYAIDEAIMVEASLPARFSSPEYAHVLTRTGPWDAASPPV